MKTLRITFFDFMINQSPKERAQNILKNFYWKAGEEPENWATFDDDIKVYDGHSRDGDAVYIDVSKEWQNWILDYLKKQKLRRIELLIKNTDDIEYGKKNADRNGKNDLSLENQIIANQYITIFQR